MSEDKKAIQINMPERLVTGVFSNIANIHLTQDKQTVLVDFMFSSPTETTLVSRIILTTEHAKALEKTLSGVLKNT